MTNTSSARRADITTLNTAAIVNEFLASFLSGDIDRAQSMVRDDFTFRAPLIEDAATKEAFFAGSQRKASHVRDFRIVRQWEDGAEVSTVYEIDVDTSAGAASMLMHEWHTVRDGQLASTIMSFDTGAPAAQLLRDALASSHS
jgi:ketosteroid isomerase-like protein